MGNRKKKKQRKKRRKLRLSRACSPSCEGLKKGAEDLNALIQQVNTSLARADLHHAALLAAHGLEQYPDNYEMLLCAGNVHENAGNVDDAMFCYSTAVKLRPDDASAISRISNLLLRLRNWRDSIPWLERLLALQPENSDTLLALGTAYLRLSDMDKAVSLLEEARRISPRDVSVLTNLGVCYRFQRQYDLGLEVLRHALELNKDRARVLGTLASLLADMGKYDDALECSEQILAFPEELEAGILAAAAYPYVKTGKYDRAEMLYRKAISLDASHSASMLGLGCILLLRERFREAWPLYRARFDIMQSWLDGPWPLWQGEELAGKKILVRAEQGLGDTIQFARFIPVLKRRGAEVIFSFQPPLKRLMKSMEDSAFLLAEKRLNVADLEVDCQAALLDLPFLLGVDKISKIPSETPYLRVDDDIRKRYKKRLDIAEDILNVGLVWAGNPAHVDDHNRSINFSRFVPLAFIDNVRLFSLQIGGAEEIARINRGNVVDATEYIDDFLDTAAIIANLDLVISVDTSVAHLAGALGKPVIILLPFSPDWRWFLGRDDSPWYPTARLLRQPAPGNWTPVIEKLVDILKSWEK